MLPDKTEKDLIAITTDDLCIRNIKMWDIFDEMKKEYPHLKVTAFTIAKFKNLESENLAFGKSGEQFLNWYSERSNWIEIALHGFTHNFPPEFLRWKEYQKKTIEDSWKTLHLFLPAHIGLRPPGSKFNEFTKQACIDLDLSYIALSDQLISLKPTKAMKCTLINSHLTPNQNDSLDKIRKDLENLLKTNACLTLSELFI